MTSRPGPKSTKRNAPRRVLREALYRFCRAANQHLRRINKSGQPVPLRDRIKVQHYKEGLSSSTLYVECIDAQMLVRQGAQALRAMPEYAPALEALKSERAMQVHWYKHIQTGHWGGLYTPESALESMAAWVFDHFGHKPLTPKIFQPVFKGFVDYFDRDAIDAFIMAPLYGLKCELGAVDLGRELGLIWLNDWHQNIIAGNIGNRRSGMRIPLLGPPRHALVVPIMLPKVVQPKQFVPSDGESTAYEQIIAACAALRLFKGGTLLCPAMVLVHDPVPFETSVTQMLLAPVGRPHPADYRLTKPDVAEFKSFWNSYRDQNLATLKRVTAATARFNQGYERHRLEDRIVDYVIALEAILLDGKLELRYKIALRGAALIGKSSSNRQDVRTRLGLAYDCRSSLVHGETLQKALKEAKVTGDPEEFVARLEDDVRQVIREFLALCTSKGEKAALDEIEQRIVTGEYPAS